ncbi:MAG: hypothetical protein GKS06_15685 [Acidobacteria bacterium]|nr:hypothetical protein [Acidobacteriota bacterium]
MNLLRDDRGAVMMSLLLGLLLTVGIAATVTVVSSSYYGEGGFDMSNPLGGPVQQRVYQGKAIADMQAMGKATTGFFLSEGRYPKDLQELFDSGYVDGMEMNDPWGSPWQYRTEGRNFIIVSYGSDSARGPKPPEGWDGEDTTPDLIIKDGSWLQVPERDVKLKAVQESIDKQRDRVKRTQASLEKAGAQ